MARKYGCESEQANQIRQELLEESEQKETLMKKIRIGLCVGIAVISLIVVISNIASIVSTSNSTNELDVKIAEAQQTLKDKQTALENTDAQVVYLDPISNDSIEAGKAVCELQNAISVEVLQEKADAKAAGVDAVDATEEHRRLLRELQVYFPEQPTAIASWSEYGTWYYTTDFVYEGDTLPVAWLCYDSNDSSRDRLLAVATATYSALDNKFNGFAVHRTAWYDVKYNGKNVSQNLKHASATVNPGDGSAGPPDSPLNAVVDEG